MSLIPVSSTAIRAIGYERGVLGVLFHTSSTVYRHPGVPYSLFVEFMDATSKGTFYKERIWGNYK